MFERQVVKEQWKPVVGWEGRYEVSNEGKIRSLDKYVEPNERRGGFVRKGKILKQHPSEKGYLYVCLMEGDRRATRRVHRLVAAAFLGPASEGVQVEHIDMNVLNNNFENLEYVTPNENVKRRTLKNKSSHGIHFVARRGEWRCRFSWEGKRHDIGYFETKDLALKAREEFIKQREEA